ncbi:MAG TPA: hypothetical protein VNS63_10070 [Blastocatellia bacterium]|nr:hypothetical protein [Blastocatellia bacterium]
MKRTVWRSMSLALCVAVTALLAFAQNTAQQKVASAKKPMTRQAKPTATAPAPDWYSVALVRVKPDMVTEWEDLQKNVVNPALKKSGLKERSVFQTAVFGTAFEYVVITQITNFAQFDEPMSPLRKTLGEDAYRDYLTKSRRCIVSTQTVAAQSRPDLSYMGKVTSMTGPPKLAVVNSISVVPGRATAFENLVKTDILPVMKKADVIGYFMNQTMFGGDGYEYTSVVFLDSFADLGKGSPFVRALGPQGAATLFAKVAGLIAHQERTIARFNPDLSFGPGGN